LPLISYQQTPITELTEPTVEAAGVRLLIKREDLNHPSVSGNKWWKLKYNLAEAIRLKHTTLLTFGGAYSNHIYATAAAAKELGLRSIGIIRGEETDLLNSTLTFAKTCGMHLHYVSREAYRHKTEIQFIEDLRKQFGTFYLIPEGGTNGLALKGCEEFAQNILSEIEFDYLCLPVGTGGTLAGIAEGLGETKKIIGFSSLKGGTFLEGEIRNLLKDGEKGMVSQWGIHTEYHFGGYGKRTEELETFIEIQWQQHKLPLDPVYTAKMMFGVWDLVKKGRFERGSTVLILHTGGLQGGGRFC
jgi:1-aminocyclopropane-1-carboxylate deaminase